MHFSEKLFCPGLFAAVYHTFKPPEKKEKPAGTERSAALPGRRISFRTPCLLPGPLEMDKLLSGIDSPAFCQFCQDVDSALSDINPFFTLIRIKVQYPSANFFTRISIPENAGNADRLFHRLRQDDRDIVGQSRRIRNGGILFLILPVLSEDDLPLLPSEADCCL